MKTIGTEGRGEETTLSCMIAAIQLDDGDAEQRLDLRRVTSGGKFGIRQSQMNIFIAAQDVGIRSRVKIQREFVAHDAIERIWILRELR